MLCASLDLHCANTQAMKVEENIPISITNLGLVGIKTLTSFETFIGR